VNFMSLSGKDMNKKSILSVLAAFLMAISSASFGTIAADGPGNQVGIEGLVTEFQKP